MPSRQNNATNIPLTYEQNPHVIDMPNVASAVYQETKRLELEIIDDLTELINYDYENFRSIDYFPGADRLLDRSPGSKLYIEAFQEVLNEINRKLIHGRPRYKYYVTLFRKYFKVSYNDNGIPVIRFSIPLSDNIVEELKIHNVSITREKGFQGESRS